MTDLIQALQDVVAAAEAGTNGRDITPETRLAECAVIARAALARRKVSSSRHA